MKLPRRRFLHLAVGAAVPRAVSGFPAPHRKCASCTSETGHAGRWPARQVRATSRLPPLYSITSSARASSESGKVIPSALAVLRLRISSTFVAC
jgi:hypothetical protein